MGPRKRILIVDDDPGICLTVERALEALECEAVATHTGEEALAAAAASPFGIVLLDLKLPGMGGMDVLRCLRDISPSSRPIVMSAHGSIENAVEAMKLGAVDFLQKPFTPKEIRELVSTVINREALVEAKAGDYPTFIELAKKSIVGYRFDEAADYVKKAVAIEPSRPEAFNLLGAIQEIQGAHPSEALRNYHAALSLDGSYAPARKNIERIAGENKYRRGRIDIDRD